MLIRTNSCGTKVQSKMENLQNRDWRSLQKFTRNAIGIPKIRTITVSRLRGQVHCWKMLKASLLRCTWSFPRQRPIWGNPVSRFWISLVVTSSGWVNFLSLGMISTTQEQIWYLSWSAVSKNSLTVFPKPSSCNTTSFPHRWMTPTIWSYAEICSSICGKQMQWELSTTSLPVGANFCWPPLFRTQLRTKIKTRRTFRWTGNTRTTWNFRLFCWNLQSAPVTITMWNIWDCGNSQSNKNTNTEIFWVDFLCCLAEMWTDVIFQAARLKAELGVAFLSHRPLLSSRKTWPRGLDAD